MKTSLSDYHGAEMDSIHYIKVLICYLLTKIKKPITEAKLLEIITDSEIINRFDYDVAISDLLDTKAIITKENEKNEKIFVITDKGRQASNSFNRYIPVHYKRTILSTAFNNFAEEGRIANTDYSIDEMDNGCMLNFKIIGEKNDMLKISLYAPNEEQAEMVAQRFRSNPSLLYRNIIKMATTMEAEKIDVEL